MEQSEFGEASELEPVKHLNAKTEKAIKKEIEKYQKEGWKILREIFPVNKKGETAYKAVMYKGKVKPEI